MSSIPTSFARQAAHCEDLQSNILSSRFIPCCDVWRPSSSLFNTPSRQGHHSVCLLILSIFKAVHHGQCRVLPPGCLKHFLQELEPQTALVPLAFTMSYDFLLNFLSVEISSQRLVDNGAVNAIFVCPTQSAEALSDELCFFGGEVLLWIFVAKLVPSVFQCMIL